MKIRFILLFLSIMFYFPLAAGAQTGDPAAQESKTMADVAKQLNNPVLTQI